MQVHEEYEAATETQLLGYDDATWAYVVPCWCPINGSHWIGFMVRYEFGGYARHNRQSRYVLATPRW